MLADAVIVAGGRGTRLAPLTDSVPKPLLPLVGVPFLVGMVRRLAQAGVERVLLVVGADPEPFDVVRSDAASAGVHVEVVPEPEPLDTAGGVRSVVDRLDGPFLVLNGDVLTNLDLRDLVAHHYEHGAKATLALIRVEDTSSYGVCVREGERIVDFVEKPPPGSLPGQDAVNAGTYVLEPETLAGFPEGPLSFERQVFPGLVGQGASVVGHISNVVWADLGTRERYLEGHRLVLDRRVSWPTVVEGSESHLGVKTEVSDSAILHEPVWIGAGSHIGDSTVIGPYAVVGAGCQIGEHARLVGTVLHDDVVIERDAHLRETVVGAGARVRAGAELPPCSLVGSRGEVTAG